jgi:hypothetical protein
VEYRRQQWCGGCDLHAAMDLKLCDFTFSFLYFLAFLSFGSVFSFFCNLGYFDCYVSFFSLYFTQTTPQFGLKSVLTACVAESAM